MREQTNHFSKDYRRFTQEICNSIWGWEEDVQEMSNTTNEHKMNSELNTWGSVRNWNLHKQLHPWIKQLMTQLGAEHMVLWAWDRQTGWQHMGQWSQTKLWISSANLDLLHQPLPLILCSSLTYSHNTKKLPKKPFVGWRFSAEEAWKALPNENQTLRGCRNSALGWDVSPGVR